MKLRDGPTSYVPELNKKFFLFDNSIVIVKVSAVNSVDPVSTAIIHGYNLDCLRDEAERIL